MDLPQKTAAARLRACPGRGIVTAVVLPAAKPASERPARPPRNNPAARLAALHAIAHGHGGRCFARDYPGYQGRAEYQCKAGHRWTTTSAIILGGSWCPSCRHWGDDKLVRIQEIARDRGGRCLSTAYVRGDEKLRFCCARGHEWETKAAKIRKGHWCKRCRTTLDDINALAAKHGGRCLSPASVEVDALFQWECARGHRFESRLRNIRLGTWCQECRREDGWIAAVRAIAERRGGALLSQRNLRSDVKLRWRCAEGHEWRSLPKNILNNRWCPACADTRLGIETMDAMAQERGGKCLSRRYVNDTTKLKWECDSGHRWSTTPSSIRYDGSWCPKCAIEANRERLRSMARRTPAESATRLAALQEVARAHGGRCLAGEYLGMRVRLEFECAAGHRFMGIPGSALNGTWCGTCKRRGSDRLRRIQEIAAERGGVCLSTEYRPARERMRFRCAQGHEWDASSHHINEGSWCPGCRHRTTTIADLNALVAEHGGRCVSKQYLDSRHALTWECKLGHRFRRHVGGIRRNGWCCPQCRTMSGAVARALQIAAERGGALVSTRRIGPNARLRWRCVKGHEWISKPVSVATGRRWCLECKRLGIDQMQALAAQRFGKCLSTEYANAHSHLLWECDRGHRWWATPNAIKHSNSWCPDCARDARCSDARDRR